MGVLPKALKLSDLDGTGTRIVKRVEGYFKKHDIAGGKFDHYRPAAVLLREQATLVPKLTKGTLERAGKLFERLNELIRK